MDRPSMPLWSAKPIAACRTRSRLSGARASGVLPLGVLPLGLAAGRSSINFAIGLDNLTLYELTSRLYLTVYERTAMVVKAIAHLGYGKPEKVVRLEEAEKPVP